MRMTTLLAGAAIALAAGSMALAQPPAGGGGRGGGRGGMQMTPEQRAEQFKTADANKDGKLSKEEFATTLPEQFRANIDQFFPTRDTNGDGSISLEELSAPGRGGRGGGGGRGGPPGGGAPAP